MQTERNFPNSKLSVPSWLLTGVITISDMLDMMLENSTQDRKKVEESIRLFFEVMEEKLRQGYSITLAFGTFRPKCGKPDPITGETSFAVEFVPTKEMLLSIEKKRLERLNHLSLN